MKTDIICKFDRSRLRCPETCDNYEEREVCLILLRIKLAEGIML